MKRASVMIIGTPAVWVAQAGAPALQDEAAAVLARRCDYEAGIAGFPREIAVFARN
jgi:hypothetical protein